jgi:acetamidase/formamidase
MRPFLGVMGMPPDLAGMHSTIPPRFCGGNIDCKELVEGSSLFLPISIEGVLFSLGDGHAVQGDGEVSGVAIECPMQQVEAEFHLHDNLHLKFPRAHTPAGWLTFAFNEDLNEAWLQALEGMLDLMGELYKLDRKAAINLASLVVDMRITQVVNQVCGVHAVLPDNAFEL